MKLITKHFRLAFFFIDYLYERRVFYEFMENLFGDANPNRVTSFFSYLASTPSELFVVDAFDFRKTRQNFDYWMEVDMEWNTFLTNNFNKL